MDERPPDPPDATPADVRRSEVLDAARGLVVALPVAVVDHVSSTPRSGDGAPADRRRQSRLAVNISAYCHIEGVPTEQAVGDLSLQGMLLQLSTHAEVGKRVRVLLSLPFVGGQKLCSLAGTVRWIEAPTTPGGPTAAGVQFDPDVNLADLETLGGFLLLWGLPRD